MAINYVLEPLISNIPLFTKTLDKDAKNSWGLCFDTKAQILYVAQTGSGVVSRYKLNSPPQILKSIKVPSNSASTTSTPGSPSGIIMNPDTKGWIVTKNPDEDRDRKSAAGEKGEVEQSAEKETKRRQYHSSVIVVTKDGLIAGYNKKIGEEFVVGAEFSRKNIYGLLYWWVSKTTCTLCFGIFKRCH